MNPFAKFSCLVWSSFWFFAYEILFILGIEILGPAVPSRAMDKNYYNYHFLNIIFSLIVMGNVICNVIWRFEKRIVFWHFKVFKNAAPSVIDFDEYEKEAEQAMATIWFLVQSENWWLSL